jgi:hypothetical protein
MGDADAGPRTTAVPPQGPAGSVFGSRPYGYGAPTTACAWTEHVRTGMFVVESNTRGLVPRGPLRWRPRVCCVDAARPDLVGCFVLTAVSSSRRTRRLEEDGFFVWPDLVPSSVVDAHIAAHEEWLDERGRFAPDEWKALPRGEQVRTFVRDYRWHEGSPAALEVFYRQALVSFLEEYFGVEPAMRAPQTGERQRGSSMHVDGMGTMVAPVGAEIRVWIALEDIDPASGPVYMVPGTHHLLRGIRESLLRDRGELAQAMVAAERRHRPTDPTPEEFIAFGAEITRALTDAVNVGRLPRVVPTLMKGDAIVFRTDLAHGTMPCADPALTRRHALAFFGSSQATWRSWPACEVGDAGAGSLEWTLERNGHGLYVSDWLTI